MLYMEKGDFIRTEEFCSNYHVEYSFISALESSGLIEITTIEQTGYISQSQLPELEKLMRLHYDLEINLEGIEAIAHLLNRNKSLQTTIHGLEEKLRLYETLYGA